jgi:hypothetical protein
MAILEKKLLELYESEPAVKAKLDTAGAVTKVKDKADKVDLTKVDSKTVAKAKAHVHAALKIPKPFVHEGITITISSLSLEGDLLRVDLDADCPTDNPYFFQNPPLQVVTKEAVMDDKDPLKIKTPRETADAADDVLQTIVGQAVHTVAVQRGWTPK